MAKITLDLVGPVTVRGPDGADLTPGSMKARGLLASLGTSRHMRMNRSKLQDRLWSASPPEQGGNSLRQCLTEIRRSFGIHRDALQSSGGLAWLDPDLIDVVLRPVEADQIGASEFAEDLDIRDPEFEDWLRQARLQFTSQQTTAPPNLGSEIVLDDVPVPVFIIAPTATGRPELDAMSDMVVRDGAQQAAEFLSALIYVEAQYTGTTQQALRLSCKAIGFGDVLSMQVDVSHLATGRQIWGRSINIDASDAVDQRQKLSAELTLALLNYEFGAGGAHEDRASLRDIFSFEPDRLFRAERALRIDEGDPRSRATRLALRAFVHNTIYFERLTDDGQSLLDEATAFCREAYDLEPQNSVVLAVSSLLAFRTKQLELAFDLATQAVRANPANPLSRYSMASAYTGNGEHETAFQEAKLALSSPLTALNPAIWLMGCSVSAVRADRLEEALRYATTAHGYAPEFRPALRAMAALHFRNGDEEATVRALTRLQQLEPDFSLKLMATDSYPVPSLRAAGLLQVTTSGLI